MYEHCLTLLVGSETQCQESNQEYYEFPEQEPPFNSSRATNPLQATRSVSQQTWDPSRYPPQPPQEQDPVQQQINILMAQLNLQHQQNHRIRQENEQLR